MEDVDDLTQLKQLTEDTMLECLSNRFWTRRIYTATGPVLLAVNPYQSIRGLYSSEMAQEFRRGSKKPHVFGIAQRAYSGMLEAISDSRGTRLVNQSILISGESGAGKTETTKLVMQYLSQCGRESESRIERQILESNPLLEAFGNARTLRNDNSSRFGKFIQLFFSHHKDYSCNLKLEGAKIETYLLEKVRVCSQSEGERNFHIFYQCCAAAASVGGVNYMFPQKIQSAERFVLKLSGFADHSYFNYLTASSSCFSASSIDDLLEFERTVQGLRTIGMSVSEIEELFSLVAAVLHVGNIDFFETDQGESCRVKAGDDALSMATALLGLPSAEALETALCTKSISVSSASEAYRSPLPASKARDVRDALARFLYGSVFSHLVARINHQTTTSGGEVIFNFCGLLDIFGFEFFKINTFEQLCINYANERLQQLFVDCVLRADQSEYQSENIEWNRLDFPDNAPIINLLDHPSTGVLPMLDEECRVVGGNDANYLSKLIKGNNIGENRDCFSIIKSKPDWFVVSHFAGKVAYKVSSGFVEKNRDFLSPDVMELVCAHKKLEVEKKRSTVSGEFRLQLNRLMALVAETNPFFIRCVKPNNRSLPDEFDAGVVAEQLRYGGVIQAVQISRAGFPVRIVLDDFVKDFKCLVPNKTRNHHHPAKAILENAKIDSAAAVGKSKIFLKQIAYDNLVSLRDQFRLHAVLRIQHWFRYRLLRRRVITAQAVIRTALVLRDISRHQAASRIQAAFVSFTVRRYYQWIRSCVVKIQRAVRRKINLYAKRKVKRKSIAPPDLVSQMQLLGAELRVAKETMKTVGSRLAYFNSGTANQSYFAPHQSVPPAPFFLSSRGQVSYRSNNENVPTVRTAASLSSSKIGSIEKRVLKAHGDMAKMKQLIDRIQHNMTTTDL